MNNYYAQITVSDNNKHLCPTLIKLPQSVAVSIIEINNANVDSNLLQLELRYHNTIVMHNIKQHTQSFQFSYDVDHHHKFIFRDTKLKKILDSYNNIFLFLHDISRDILRIIPEKNTNKLNIIASFYIENYLYYHQLYEKKYKHFI